MCEMSSETKTIARILECDEEKLYDDATNRREQKRNADKPIRKSVIIIHGNGHVVKKRRTCVTTTTQNTYKKTNSFYDTLL